MAVKIIDPKPDPKMAKRISCKECGAKLEYFKIDIQIRNGTDYSGGPDGEEFIKCPCCKEKVILRSW